ncbi:MAG: sulfurtransferase [Pseudomonadota bacterium]
MQTATGHMLVSTDWLHENLNNSNLRVFDCTTILRPHPEKTYEALPARETFDEGHIPGAGFIDLQGDFSAPDSPFRFTLPDAAAFAAAAARQGISNSSHLVLYSTTAPMWATRLWWMFRVFGHERVSVLDGGFPRWRAEGKPVDQAPPIYREGSYTATLDSSRVVDKAGVLAAIEDQNTCIINALSREQYRGEGPGYGRPGRIKGSESLPWSELLDELGCFLPAEKLREKLAGTSAPDAGRIITYCGGGIAASVTLFALALTGQEDRVALYDNSLSEWAADSSAPMETG